MVKRAGQEALQSGELQPQQQKHETEILSLLSSHPPTFLWKISRLMSWWREIRLLRFSLLPFSRLTKQTQRSPQPTHVLLSAVTAQGFLNDPFYSGHRETESKERGRSPLTWTGALHATVLRPLETFLLVEAEDGFEGMGVAYSAGGQLEASRGQTPTHPKS